MRRFRLITGSSSSEHHRAGRPSTAVATVSPIADELEPAADAVIVGAGLAGLAAAVELHEAGLAVAVLEVSDGVGGRVRTDRVDGFLLDRGFQVVLTAYPELHRRFDVAALDLRRFEPGADVWDGGRSSTVGDPLRRPTTALATLRAPIGSPGDKLRILALRWRLTRAQPAELLRGDDISTAEALAAAGFSTRIVDRFFRPLFAGIQLDPELATSRRVFDVIFRSLGRGDSAVPAQGMQALPEQLAGRLPTGTVRLGRRVVDVRPGSVGTEDGHRFSAAAIVVATEGPVASRLLGLPPVASRGVGCAYFAAVEAPTETTRVQLGVREGVPVNAAVMSNVASTYAPAGRHLVVVALPGVLDEIADRARDAVRSWWGPAVDGWEHLRSYAIEHGQPDQRPPFDPKRRVSLGDGLFVCGDHRDTASIQGALYSGRRTAEAVLAQVAAETGARQPP